MELLLSAAAIIVSFIVLTKINRLTAQTTYLQEQLNKFISRTDHSVSNQDDIKTMLQLLKKLESSKNMDIAKETPPLLEEEVALKATEVVQTLEDPVVETHGVIEDNKPIIDLKAVPTEVEEIAPMTRDKGEEITEIEPTKPSKLAAFTNFFKENTLTKVGIITLVLGIAFFVKYAIDQEWINEIGRVGIGVITGALIIGIAHKLNKEYAVFSSILVGGGISVLYITITLAFREYALFSQSMAFIVLILITLLSVVLSLYYDRKELAIFSLLGGFASPLMISSGNGQYIALFGYILVLNSGMLVLSIRKNWRSIGIICYVLTNGFFWIWLLNGYKDQAIGSFVFATLFFIQFYALALIDHYVKNNKLNIYQALLLLTNNMAYFVAILVIFDPFEYQLKGFISMALAVTNALVMLVLFKSKKVDKNFIYLIIAVVLSFTTLAIPLQMNGYVITLFWAAETVILLWLWQKSRIVLFFHAFILMNILSVGSYFIDLIHSYGTVQDQALPLLHSSIFITGLVFIIALALNRFLLSKEDKTFLVKPIGSLGDCRFGVQIALTIACFIVPFLELNHQINYRVEILGLTSFRLMSLLAYSTIFLLICEFIYKKRQDKTTYMAVCLINAGCVLAFWISNNALRKDVFYTREFAENYSTAQFAIHLVPFFAILWLIYRSVQNAQKMLNQLLTPFYGVLVVAVTLLLSLEIENISLILFHQGETMYGILYDVRTFVFPILWGIIAMGIMVWGIKTKQPILRKISLVFFAFIIVKFYAYDVWNMSQAGRIISFILLGVIILLVSFLQEKIKVLVVDEKTEDEQKNRRDED